MSGRRRRRWSASSARCWGRWRTWAPRAGPSSCAPCHVALPLSIPHLIHHPHALTVRIPRACSEITATGLPCHPSFLRPIVGSKLDYCHQSDEHDRCNVCALSTARSSAMLDLSLCTLPAVLQLRPGRVRDAASEAAAHPGVLPVSRQSGGAPQPSPQGPRRRHQLCVEDQPAGVILAASRCMRVISARAARR